MQNKQTRGRHDWKLSYITNNESHIFIQEEVNFIPILFTWYSLDSLWVLYFLEVFITLKEEINLIFYIIRLT